MKAPHAGPSDLFRHVLARRARQHFDDGRAIARQLICAVPCDEPRSHAADPAPTAPQALQATAAGSPMHGLAYEAH